MRRPTIIEAIAQIIVLALLVPATWDVVSAFNGLVCRDYAQLEAGGCYAWGWEGPFADIWFYRSQEAYLGAGLLRAGLLMIALVLPILSRRRWLNLIAMGTLLIVAYPALLWVPYVFENG